MKTLKMMLAVACMISMNLAVFAQPGDGSDGFGDDPQDAPVDGGVALLLVAGAAYGYKKLKTSLAKKV
ncbi:MAG: PID-CTERM protein-sorting domain-containing protein [Bacteroidia bacterium]|jgi:hypothetical protein